MLLKVPDYTVSQPPNQRTLALSAFVGQHSHVAPVRGRSDTAIVVLGVNHVLTINSPSHLKAMVWVGTFDV